MTEEADVILKRMGAFLLSSIGGRDTLRFDDYRAQLINFQQFKTEHLGAIEEQDDHLASRYGKSVDAVHRIAGLCQIIELTSGVFKALIERYGCFEENSISNEFVSKYKALFCEFYGSYITNNRCFYISIDVVERAIDIISGNLEQYKLLMLTPANESFNFSSIVNKPVESLSIISHMDKKVKEREKFGTVKQPSSVRLFSDTSVNDINSIQDDFDIPLNNCVLNNIDYEHSLQIENSTAPLSGGIDSDLVENEETSLVGSYASSDSHGSNNEECNQYFENQTSQPSTDIDVLAGSSREEILIDANGSENVGIYKKGRKRYSSILQVLDVRLIKGKEAENTSSDKRYRLILSDGRNVFSSCVLGADMIDLVKNDILKNNSVVRVDQVDVCNAGVKGDRVILIIRDVAVVLSGCEKIDDPAPLVTCHIRSAIWI
ncbi:unnamed protein product [Rotaria socialis]|uniref:Replication factor-A protein 1 N-terminal domain-containing protein n=1 Tax=Rotaria socialis TaxID=392032 RepID=A0A819VR14_9BILA|nr:unnamed protein product [Rotaria socialis]